MKFPEGTGCYDNTYERSSICGLGVGKGRESLPKQLRINLTDYYVCLAMRGMWEKEIRDEAILSLSLYLEDNGWQIKEF